jgi:hypothetical protein
LIGIDDVDISREDFEIVFKKLDNRFCLLNPTAVHSTTEEFKACANDVLVDGEAVLVRRLAKDDSEKITRVEAIHVTSLYSARFWSRLPNRSVAGNSRGF